MNNKEGEQDRWFWKGVRELAADIKNAGLQDKLRHFNDVLWGRNAPGGYGEPVLTDVIIDGRKCDVYHTDKKPNDSYHRVYLHVKE